MRVIMQNVPGWEGRASLFALPCINVADDGWFRGKIVVRPKTSTETGVARTPSPASGGRNAHDNLKRSEAFRAPMKIKASFQ